MNTLKNYQPFQLESGEVLPEITIAYHTYGTLNAAKDNVVWVFHALTANTDAADWWNGLIGEGKIIDPSRYFIVCANMLGSSYGATNAYSINPLTGQSYGKSFPVITTRDVVASHQILQKHLDISKIYIGIGGSMGGQQGLEWAIKDPSLFENLVVLAAGAKMYPWAIGLNEAQRMALSADTTLYDDTPEAGIKGMEAARAIGMMTYRSYESYNSLQEDKDEKFEKHRVTTYLQYQGLKLSRRYSPLAYLSITKTMDSHNVGRNRGGIKKALQNITAKTLVVGIRSDLLFPIDEQIELAANINDAQLEIINSHYGHDGFLIEFEQITTILKDFLSKNKNFASNTLANIKKSSLVEVEA